MRSQAVAAVKREPEPGPAYILPELISGGRIPKSIATQLLNRLCGYIRRWFPMRPLIGGAWRYLRVDDLITARRVRVEGARRRRHRGRPHAAQPGPRWRPGRTRLPLADLAMW